MFHSNYRGFVIWRNLEPGYRLRWTARHDNGDRFAADTLAGLRELIRGA